MAISGRVAYETRKFSEVRCPSSFPASDASSCAIQLTGFYPISKTRLLRAFGHQTKGQCCNPSRASFLYLLVLRSCETRQGTPKILRFCRAYVTQDLQSTGICISPAVLNYGGPKTHKGRCTLRLRRLVSDLNTSSYIVSEGTSTFRRACLHRVPACLPAP